jgi:hypothetical protein
VAKNADIVPLLQAADDLVPDLETIVDDLKRVAASAVGDLKAESAESVTSSGERARLSGDFVRRLREASTAVGAAVKAENDLHRTAASRARAMTQEQRVAALVKLVAGMPYADRRGVLLASIYEHNRVAKDTDRPANATTSFVDLL